MNEYWRAHTDASLLIETRWSECMWNECLFHLFEICRVLLYFAPTTYTHPLTVICIAASKTFTSISNSKFKSIPLAKSHRCDSSIFVQIIYSISKWAVHDTQTKPMASKLRPNHSNCCMFNYQRFQFPMIVSNHNNLKEFGRFLQAKKNVEKSIISCSNWSSKRLKWNLFRRRFSIVPFLLSLFRSVSIECSWAIDRIYSAN